MRSPVACVDVTAADYNNGSLGVGDFISLSHSEQTKSRSSVSSTALGKVGNIPGHVIEEQAQKVSAKGTNSFNLGPERGFCWLVVGQVELEG